MSSRLLLSIAFFAALVSCRAPVRTSGSAQDFGEYTKEHRLADFSWITSIFDEHYAMLDRKKSLFAVDYEVLKLQLLKKLESQEMSKEQFEALIQEFVASFRDGHTSVMLYRNFLLDGWDVKVTTLGFKTERALDQGRNVAKITDIYEKFFQNAQEAPIQEGDVVVSIDGRDIDVIAKEDIQRFHDVGHQEANLTFSYAALANRANFLFAKVPEGVASVQILRNGQPLTVRLPWMKASLGTLEPEQAAQGRILDIDADGRVLVQKRGNGPVHPHDFVGLSPMPRQLKHGMAVHSRLQLSLRLGTLAGRDYPDTTSDFSSEGLSFKLMGTEKGLVAIHRVEDFVLSRLRCEKKGSGDDTVEICDVIKAQDYANAFLKLSSLGVKALVFDLRSNPGGALPWGYELVRALTREGVSGNLASVRLTEEWLGDFRWSAERADLPTVESLMWKQAYDTLLADARSGVKMSSPVSIVGQPTLLGVPNAWNGKTFVLVDEQCASMCDIFATLLQDHGIAKILGRQSMGAGGNVVSYEWSPHTKIAVSQTESIIYRIDGSPIENAGVIPDVAIAPTTGEEFWKAAKAAMEANL